MSNNQSQLLPPPDIVFPYHGPREDLLGSLGLNEAIPELDKLTLMDLGSHVLDTARFLFGEAQSVYCQHVRGRDDIKGEDVATVVMRMGEVICNCEMSNATRTPWQHFPDVLMFIEGTKGSIELGPDYWIRVTTDDGTTARRVEPEYCNWLRADMLQMHASMVPCNRNCLDYIKTGQPAETSGDDNLKTMRLIFAAYESADKNVVVELNEAK